MNRLKTLLLAAMLAIFCTYAQQLKPAYAFRAIVSTGGYVGGRVFTLSTAIDTVALSDTGEVAFVAHWTEAGSNTRTAVFTSKRRIASDGDVIDHKPVTRIKPTSLAINNVGQVAFEALFGNPIQTGIFIDRKFIEALSVSDTANDFLLTDDGKIVLKMATAAAENPASGVNTPNQPIIPRGVTTRVPTALGQILFGRNSPIRSADPNVILQPRPTAPQKPQQQAQVKPVVAGVCASPEFPIPASWAVGDSMVGPVASHSFEAPVKARVYDSRLYGPMGSPFRVIQFNAECKPLLIVIGDNFLKERYEFWTPNGLLTHTAPDGTLDLNGFSGKVLPDQLARADAAVRVNKHGQVLLHVSVEPEGFAILLGTPR